VFSGSLESVVSGEIDKLSSIGRSLQLSDMLPHPPITLPGDIVQLSIEEYRESGTTAGFDLVVVYLTGALSTFDELVLPTRIDQSLNSGGIVIQVTSGTKTAPLRLPLIQMKYSLAADGDDYEIWVQGKA